MGSFSLQGSNRRTERTVSDNGRGERALGRRQSKVSSSPWTGSSMGTFHSCGTLSPLLVSSHQRQALLLPLGPAAPALSQSCRAPSSCWLCLRLAEEGSPPCHGDMPPAWAQQSRSLCWGAGATHLGGGLGLLWPVLLGYSRPSVEALLPVGVGEPPLVCTQGREQRTALRLSSSSPSPKPNLPPALHTPLHHLWL